MNAISFEGIDSGGSLVALPVRKGREPARRGSSGADVVSAALPARPPCGDGGLFPHGARRMQPRAALLRSLSAV